MSAQNPLQLSSFCNSYSPNPLVSIIIPTKNSQGNLDICLDSIQKQTYDNIEVIIVDSNSKDRTRDIASRYCAKVLSYCSKMAAARNHGAKHAKGEYLFHMDSDMKLKPKVVEKCVEALQKGAHAVVIPQTFEGEGFLGKCRALEFDCLVGDAMIKSSRFMTKTAFESVGGYDAALEAGEDWDITQKIEARYTITSINQHLTHGWGRYNLLKHMKKSYNYGKSVKIYMDKYPHQAKHQWGPMRIKHLNYAKLSHDAFHAIGLFLIKSCEFAAGWIGMMTAC